VLPQYHPGRMRASRNSYTGQTPVPMGTQRVRDASVLHCAVSNLSTVTAHRLLLNRLLLASSPLSRRWL